tara:strand:- start:610 stop:840 length:231 start_codon:yes stop_codon:yes gene_type:complete
MMEDDNYVRDALGWIDDFSAPPGMVGQPFTRHIMLYSEFNVRVGACLRELNRLKFDKQEVKNAISQLIDEVYDGCR